MRSAVDLFGLEYTFTQQPLLTADQFCRSARDRGVDLDVGKLEALHQAGQLIPLFRVVSPDPSRQPPEALSGFRPDLRKYLDDERLIDPRNEPFADWRSHQRWSEGRRWWEGGFLYSPYQLLALYEVERLLPYVRTIERRDDAFRYEVRFYDQDYPRPAFGPGEFVPTDWLVLLHAVDPIYLPLISGRIHLVGGGRREDFPQYRRYAARFQPKALMDWLAEPIDKLVSTGERLLIKADSLDPNRAWVDLIRLIRWDEWERLRGRARQAIDLRIAAECLWRFHDDLVDKGLTPALPTIPKMADHPIRRRLKRDWFELDNVLTDMGISPYPALVLALEGATETFLLQRAMEWLEMPRYRSYIELFNAGGVDKDFSLVASYVATPELGEEIQSGVVLLRRPVTRYLVVTDPEGRLRGRADRARLRENIVRQLHAGLPEKHRTRRAKSEIRRLVHVITWDAESFEFAHFENAEIESAIQAFYRKRRRRIPTGLASRIANVRKHRGNLQAVLDRTGSTPRMTKLDLAEELWPILRSKLEAARAAKQLQRIPLIRVLRLSHEFATRSLRHSIAIRT